MFEKTYKYDMEFLKENMMGPNSMLILEEMTESLNIKPGMKILDLGCGKGLTSIFLAKEYGATVFATDLWIDPTENYQRFKAFGLEDKIIPIHAEARDLPFAQEYFDLVVSVDAYNYFGAKEDYLDEHLAPLVKKGGEIAIATPGFKKDFPNGVPAELEPFWGEDYNFFSCEWWSNLWKSSKLTTTKKCYELTCHDQAWRDWLTCDNDYARRDIDMMKAEGGKYFNFVFITAERNAISATKKRVFTMTLEDTSKTQQ